MKKNDYDYLFKILVVGDSGVGKSSLISRFCLDNFQDIYKATSSIDFTIKKNIYIDGASIRLQIWDTFYDRFRMQRIPYRGAHGILIVFDLNDAETFTNALKWYQEVQRYASEYVIVGIVGTKNDILEISQGGSISNSSTKRADALDFTHQVDANYHEVSSKYDQGINACFMDLVYRVYKDKIENSFPSPSTSSPSNITLNLKRKPKPKSKQNCIIS